MNSLVNACHDGVPGYVITFGLAALALVIFLAFSWREERRKNHELRSALRCANRDFEYLRAATPFDYDRATLRGLPFPNDHGGPLS